MKIRRMKALVLMSCFLFPLASMAEDLPNMALLEFLADDDIDQALLDHAESIQPANTEEDLIDADDKSAESGEEI